MEKYDVIIIGAGVSGLAAGMYAGRLNLNTLVIGENKGGTIALTTDVENYPGFITISGLELAKKLEEHAKHFCATIIEEPILKIKKDRRDFTVFTKTKKYSAKTIIIATGTERRKLKIPGEDKFMNNGVHTCVLCDGIFYKNKITAVIGGSDSAAKEALLLAKYARKVYIIYRREKIRPEPINYERIMKNKKITIINNANVIEIKGNKKVKSIILDRAYKNNKELNLDGVLIEIGQIPLSAIVRELKVKLNEKGEIIINRNSETNVQGLFAAGDVTDTEFKQAITGVAEAVTASYSAYKYISKNKIN